ncbi:MAG: alpha/beta hydrolase [Pseudomonadota bacterium]
MKIRHHHVNTGRLTLHVAELGVGEPVLLVHGFPSYWEDWREQMEALAGNGFRAIAFDLPGYGESERLPNVLDYRAALVAADIAGLIRALELPSVHVLGHDWGGTLAYCLAAEHPELVKGLIVLNAGHPELFRTALQHYEQLRRSWYMFLFQLPWLPEWLLQRRAAMSLALRGMEVRPGAFSDADLDRYVAVMRRPGAACAALSYYRAAFRVPVRTRRTIKQRTLVLWGDQDKALSGALLLPDLPKYVPGVRTERFAHAGHWLHHDVPTEVTFHVLSFLNATGSGQS